MVSNDESRARKGVTEPQHISTMYTSIHTTIHTKMHTEMPPVRSPRDLPINTASPITGLTKYTSNTSITWTLRIKRKIRCLTFAAKWQRSARKHHESFAVCQRFYTSRIPKMRMKNLVLRTAPMSSSWKKPWKNLRGM